VLLILEPLRPVITGGGARDMVLISWDCVDYQNVM